MLDHKMTVKLSHTISAFLFAFSSRCGMFLRLLPLRSFSALLEMIHYLPVTLTRHIDLWPRPVRSPLKIYARSFSPPTPLPIFSWIVPHLASIAGLPILSPRPAFQVLIVSLRSLRLSPTISQLFTRLLLPSRCLVF